jgi:hypothetical protein
MPTVDGRLDFLYTPDNSTGYGRMGTQLARQFRAMGLDVHEQLRATDDPSPVVMWGGLSTGVQGWFAGQHRVLLTMWEGTRIGEELRQGLDNLDQVFVPCLQNLETFSQYHPDVTQVNLGIDPVTWHYRPREKPWRFFKFLADGRGSRKGTDLAIAAFRRAFPVTKPLPGPTPQLVLHGSSNNVTYQGRDIWHTEHKVPDEEEPELYAACHVFLAPTRGEGWGLQPLQAIAQGMPTVLTDAHGQASYAHLGWPLRAKPVKSEDRLFGDAGDWWEADLDQLADYMQEIYWNYEEACSRAVGYSATALADLSWAKSAESIIRALRVDLNADFTPGDWVKPTARLYPVVLRVGHVCHVSGESFGFQAGKLYWERAEIKRMFFEKGWLDPACMDMPEAESGLLPRQVAEIGGMSAAHEACPTCGQRFNSKPLHEYEDMGTSGL